MARKIAVLSGKGGVGKSTVAANLSFALAKKSKRVLLCDMDFGLNSLDILLSCQNNIIFDLADVINNKCRFKQAVINDKLIPNLYVMLSGSFVPTVQNLNAFASLIKKEESGLDYIFFDCSAGLNRTLDVTLSVCDEVICVVTPHYVSVKDAAAVIKYTKQFNPLCVHAVLNRIRGDLVKSGEQMSAFEVFSLLKVKQLGIVPECDGLNGFLRKDSSYFDVIANNLQNGKHKLFDYMAEYKGLIGKIKCKIHRND